MLPADLPALRRLFLESRRAAFTWLDPATLSLEDFDASIAGETVLVATHDGRTAGFVAWWPPENFVHSLFVAPGHERRGIGRGLLSEALARMGRPAQLKIDAANGAAAAFYRALGWVAVGSGTGPHGEYHLLQFD